MKSPLALALAAATLAMPAVCAEPAPATAPAPKKVFTTTETEIGTLLAHPEARAVIDKYFPGVSTADTIGLASAMTLRQLQQFKPQMFTDEALAKVDADLAKITVK